MGDMGDYFRDWDAAKKKRKVERLDDAKQSKWPCKWTKHTEFHWSAMVQGYRLDYWPSTGKWMWRSKIMHGNLIALKGFISKRLAA